MEEKLTGIQSIGQLEDLEAAVSNQTTGLLNDSQELNSNLFLNAIRKMHLETLDSSKSLTCVIEGHLHKNEAFEASIHFRQEYLPEINSAVRKMFTLQFKYPHLHQSTEVFLNNSSAVYSRASSCHKRSPSLSRNNSTINFNTSQPALDNSSQIRTNNNSQIQYRSQLRETWNTSSQLKLVPKFIDEKNMRKFVGNCRHAERKSSGINVVSNE